MMSDSDKKSLEYFSKHLTLMKVLGQNANYKVAESIEEFFENTKGA